MGLGWAYSFLSTLAHHLNFMVGPTNNAVFAFVLIQFYFRCYHCISHSTNDAVVFVPVTVIITRVCGEYRCRNTVQYTRVQCVNWKTSRGCTTVTVFPASSTSCLSMRLSQWQVGDDVLRSCCRTSAVVVTCIHVKKLQFIQMLTATYNTHCP